MNAVQREKLWRDEVGPVPGVESLTYSAQFFDRGPEIDYQLSHPDDRAREQAAEMLKQRVAEIPAATEVQDTYALGKRQFDITKLTPPLPHQIRQTG